MKFDLVFEGGGAKGMAFVGAWAELQARGHGFDRLLGTSAGAIAATLLAAGYSPDEMQAALGEKENGKSVFAGFMGEPAPFSDEEIEHGELLRVLRAIDVKLIPDFLERRVDAAMARLIARNERFRNALALLERGGWFSADRFVTWMRARLDAPRPGGAPRAFSGMDLGTFRETTGVELSMVVSDTTDGAMLVLNARTAPRCPVVWAVRMSMSIPLVWNEVVWDEAWGPYRDRDLGGHVMVDGGLLSNFPMELFLSAEPYVQKLMGPKGSAPVLGLLIDEELAVPGPRGLVSVNIKPGELALVQRIRRLADTATSAHDKMVLDEYADRVVHLPAKGYGTTEFDMPDARREALVQAARRATAAFLDAPAPRPRAARAAGAPGATSQIDRVAARMLERSEAPPEG
jgi:predicted acylesterase/phospholipase RssA